MSLRASPVDDATIIQAIRTADSRAVNGEPGPKTIADECPLSLKRVSRRLKFLEDEGKIERHESVALDTNSTFKTAVVVDDA